MRTSQELDQLLAQAVELRRQGKSRREIKQILGHMGNTTLNEALAGEPPPEWTRRPNAKDELRPRASVVTGKPSAQRARLTGRRPGRPPQPR